MGFFLLWRKGFAFGKHSVVNYLGWGSYGFGPVLLHPGKPGNSFWSNPTTRGMMKHGWVKDDKIQGSSKALSCWLFLIKALSLWQQIIFPFLF